MSKFLLSVSAMSLSALLWGARADSSVTPLSPLSDAGGAFSQFSSLMNWFIIALVAISVISAVRMYIVKRRNGKNPPKPETPTPISGDPNLPKLRRNTFSWPLLILLGILSVIVYQTFTRSNEQITKEANEWYASIQKK